MKSSSIKIKWCPHNVMGIHYPVLYCSHCKKHFVNLNVKILWKHILWAAQRPHASMSGVWIPGLFVELPCSVCISMAFPWILSSLPAFRRPFWWHGVPKLPIMCMHCYRLASCPRRPSTCPLALAPGLSQSCPGSAQDIPVTDWHLKQPFLSASSYWDWLLAHYDSYTLHAVRDNVQMDESFITFMMRTFTIQF